MEIKELGYGFFVIHNLQEDDLSRIVAGSCGDSEHIQSRLGAGSQISLLLTNLRDW